MMCEGRAAIVTGAAGKGMGRSIALTLAREGASVVVNFRSSADAAAEVVRHICDTGQDAVAVQADVSTAEGCKKLVSEAMDRFKRVDICVVNPGGEWRLGPIEKINPADSIQDVTAEVAPLFHLMPLLLPRMYKRKWGRIIGLGLAESRDISPHHGFSYCVGKVARTEATLMLKSQAAGHGVTANMIAPGPVSPIETLAEAIEECDHGPAWTKRKGVSPQDIAESVAFLCSEAGSFISGAVLPYMHR